MTGSEPPSMRLAQSYLTSSSSHFSLGEYSFTPVLDTNSEHFDNCIMEKYIKSEDRE
jgi:hypothetical protein